MKTGNVKTAAQSIVTAMCSDIENNVWCVCVPFNLAI